MQMNVFNSYPRLIKFQQCL